MLLWGVLLVFGIGIVLLVVVLVAALIDNRLNYGQWKPKRTPPADRLGPGDDEGRQI